MQEDGSFDQEEGRRLFWEARGRAFPESLEQARRIADSLAEAVQAVFDSGVDVPIEHNVDEDEYLGQMVANILQRERKLETVLAWRHVWKWGQKIECLKCTTDYKGNNPGCNLIVTVKPFWKFEIKQ